MTTAAEKELRAEVNALRSLVDELIKHTGMDAEMIRRMEWQAAKHALLLKRDKKPMEKYIKRYNKKIPLAEPECCTRRETQSHDRLPSGEPAHDKVGFR